MTPDGPTTPWENIEEEAARCPECNGWPWTRRWVHNAAYEDERYQGWVGSHRPCDSTFHPEAA